RRLVQADHRAERSGDQVQLVLDDEVRWTQRRARHRLRRRQRARLVVRVTLFSPGHFVEIRRAVAMPRALRLDSTEQRMQWSLPRELREFVDSGDDERRQQPADLLVHGDYRQPLVRALLAREIA